MHWRKLLETSTFVAFGDRRVGNGEPCFVTFQAGPTHNGLETAQQLISLAAETCLQATAW